MTKKIDLDTHDSRHSGFKGFFERLLRRFKTLMHTLTMVPVYGVGSSILGMSLVPGIALFRWYSVISADWNYWLQNLGYGICLSTGFLLYGITLMILVPLVNFLIRGYLKPWRGPYYSAESFKWFVHNSLTYLVRFTFLEFVTPSPLSIAFYRAMGMKIGRDVTINTTWISDPSLIELGNKTLLGGSVTIVAHYGQSGLLVISPVKIGERCDIGLKATIMGGVQIGDNVKIRPHSVVLPKTVIPAGETWGGVPAQKIS